MNDGCQKEPTCRLQRTRTLYVYDLTTNTLFSQYDLNNLIKNCQYAKEYITHWRIRMAGLLAAWKQDPPVRFDPRSHSISFLWYNHERFTEPCRRKKTTD
jgi:hypothetical protein